MPARAIDADLYASMADPLKTASKKEAGRASEPDDPYASLYDPKTLPDGVVITGYNAAGQPIFGPAGRPEPQGSAARRFLGSAGQVFSGAAKGLYHSLVEGPQNPDEAAVEKAGTESAGGGFGSGLAGRSALVFNRFITAPMGSEAKKTAEARRQGDRSLALGHGLATVLPGVGPAAAQAGERIGTQAGTGDYAGAAGTLAGNVALYSLPEAAGKVLGSELVTRSIPRGEITRMIRPAAGDLKFGKDPAMAILDERIIGNTLEDIGNKVSDRLAGVGKQLDREARKPVNARKVVDVSASLMPIDDAMTEAAKAGDRQLFAKLIDVKSELANNWKPFRTAKGDIILRPTGPRNLRLSPIDALRFKRMVGDRVRWTEDPLQGAVNQALGKVYGKIKDATNTAVPELKSLNERYSNLVGAAKAIQRRLPVEARNAHWSLSDVALGASGHLPLAIARYVARWPAIRTRTAAGLHALPRAVPKRPTAIAAPVIGGAQSAQSLPELKQQADGLRPAVANY